MNNADKKITTIIGYHANCIDGFTSAWVTYNALTKELHDCSLLEMRYDEQSLLAMYAMLNEYKPNYLYLVDYSIPFSALTDLRTNYPKVKVIILDHHKTAFEKYFPGIEVKETTRKHATVEGAYVVLENDKSGASLCWNYFHAKVGVHTPKLIQYVEDHDLWRFNKGVETKHINKYLSSMEKEIKLWDWIANELEYPHGLMYMLDTGKQLQVAHDNEVADIVKKAKPITLFGTPGYVAMCHPKFSSDVGNELAKIKGTFGATYSVDEELKAVKWSLRSMKTSTVDVSAIASKMGGGGHKNAAGFEVSFATKVGDTPNGN